MTRWTIAPGVASMLVILLAPRGGAHGRSADTVQFAG
jgi:hypothetical protein